MKNIIRIACFLALTMVVAMPSEAQQQNSNIVRGTVIAATDGEPLISVSVTEIDPSNRIVGVTITNYDGEYVLQISSPGNKLRFKYLGFETKDVEIGNKRVINVSLDEQTVNLTEATVTARAMQSDGRFNIPQREVSTAMQKISTEEFDGIQVSSIDDALQGRIAGLDIVNVSGEPGAGMSMRIRGTTSINGSSEPLIVIDDIPYETEIADDFDFATANQDAYAQLINVNPDDIESITVLKDAASTAMYGAKGASGVLLITTKKGKAGPTRIDYALGVTGNKQPKGMNMLNGDDYTMLMKQSYYLPHLDETASNVQEFNYDTNFTEYENFNNNTDWREEVSQIGISQDHTLTVSGGGDKVTFRVSGGYTHESGTCIGQALKRLSMRANVTYRVSDRITFSSDFSYTYSDNPKSYEDLLSNAYKKMPNLTVYSQDVFGNETDSYYHIREDSKLNDSQKKLSNPVAVADLARNYNYSYRTSPVFTLIYEFLDRSKTAASLKLNANVSFDINSSQKSTYFPREASNASWSASTVNLSERSESESMGVRGDVKLVWASGFANDNHRVTAMARFTINGSTSEQLGMGVYGLPSSQITSSSVNAYVNKLSSGYSESKSINYSASAHYAYAGRYIFDLTLAYAGSTKFGPNYRFGLFPGISASWIISDETFFDPIRNVVSMLKPRVSWGLTGKEPSENYLYYSRYAQYDYGYIDMIAIHPVNMQLSNLKWENTTQLNGGLDLEFFDGKYSLSFDYYYKNTTDLLFKNLGISSSSGFSALTNRNNGAMSNRGWELNIHLNELVKVNKFRIDANFNFSNNKNQIDELSEDVLARYNPEYDYANGTYLTRIQIGNSVGSIYGFKYLGVYEYGEYDPEHPDRTCPIARDANGNAILDANGKTKPMYFAYGKSNAYEFKAGDAMYEDINHDGTIDELDIVYLGNSLPKVNGGFGITFRYGQFSLQTFFNYRVGNKVVNGARMNAENMYTNDNQSVAVNWRWRKEGDQTEMPRALYNYGYNWLGSDRYVEDASFLRFKYLTFNYSIPRDILKPAHLSQCSFYLSFQNVATFTSYTGVDPEVSTGGYSVATDNAKTPRAKQVVFRLRLGF